MCLSWDHSEGARLDKFGTGVQTLRHPQYEVASALQVLLQCAMASKTTPSPLCDLRHTRIANIWQPQYQRRQHKLPGCSPHAHRPRPGSVRHLVRSADEVQVMFL